MVKKNNLKLFQFDWGLYLINSFDPDYYCHYYFRVDVIDKKRIDITSEINK